ncbi:MAG: GNAT family N-acetyltransferase [Methyloceanibacter sp.]|uniref:GNAT family N-acetyltransferase n=1 Tax=Methyloceanibacter sp. TaxID=1965321 RepID=UPI003D6D9508
MTSELVIRPFAADDLPRLQEVRAAAFSPIFESFRTIVGEAISARAFDTADADQAALLDGICRPGSTHRVFVALMDSEIVGFVSLTLDQAKRTGEIGLNAVHPSHARQGIGTQLYAFAISVMRDERMRLATVGTGADPSHAPARRAYEKAGFEVGVPSVFLYKVL